MFLRLLHLIHYYWTEYTFGMIVVLMFFILILAVVFRQGYLMGNYAKLLDKAEKKFQEMEEDYRHLCEKEDKI